MNTYVSRLALLILVTAGSVCLDCSKEQTDFGANACQVSHGEPYPGQIPYVGIHANPANNDFVPCTAAEEFTLEWHVLKGHAIAQPNTFSPDGSVTYVTTSHPQPDGCRLHAVRVSDGEILWCKTYSLDVMGSSVEVCRDGHLYFSAGTRIHSLTASGEERWSADIPQPADPEKTDGALGLHFTPDGHIATVTNQGQVLLLDRETGGLLASLNIPDSYGFVPPPGISLGIDLAALLPPAVLDNITAIYGGATGQVSLEEAISIFLGSGGSYSNNTIGVAPSGELYVMGGGVDEESGALVQVRVGGSADSPALEPGWALHTVGGSATSPSISPDGRYVSVGDGASAMPIFAPTDLDGHMYVADIPACDANTDADPEPEACAPVAAILLQGRAIAGSPPLLDGPVLYFWDMPGAIGQAGGWLRAYQEEQLLWESELPDNRIWTAVMTVTENYIIGTTSAVELSEEQLLTFTFPASSDDRLTLVDRHSGELVFSSEVTDDCAATVTIGPRGSLYAGILGLLSMMSTEQQPVLGLARFSPATGQ